MKNSAATDQHDSALDASSARPEPEVALRDEAGAESRVGDSVRRWRQRVAVVAMMVFVLGVSASVWRVLKYHQTPGPFNPAKQGYCDFHNGFYFPALAFREGVSPYSLQYNKLYPTERPIPFYSPLIVALHVPITYLPLAVAEVMYFIWSIALLLLIAYLTVRWLIKDDASDDDEGLRFRWDIFWIVASAIILSRGGQQTVFTGYFTFELILGAMFAVQYGKTRPWYSAIGLALISAKPTYVLPIAGLMLFRGNFRAVILGAVLSITGAGLSFGWLAQNRSIADLRSDIETTQEIHRGDWYELPVNSWTRLDLLAIVAKWMDWSPTDTTHLIAMHLVLFPPAILLAFYHRRTDDDGELAGLSGAIVMATSLIAIYHHVYDALLLTLPVAAILLVSRDVWMRCSGALRFALAGCLLMPAVNYASSLLVIERFGIEGQMKQVFTSVNGIALSIAVAMLLLILLREIQNPRSSAA